MCVLSSCKLNEIKLQDCNIATTFITVGLGYKINSKGKKFVTMINGHSFYDIDQKSFADE